MGEDIYQNYKPAQQAPESPARSFSVTTPLYKEGIQEVQRYLGNLVTIALGGKDPTTVLVEQVLKQK